jgi:tetratricopeptide (TPR) repeat protein
LDLCGFLAPELPRDLPAEQPQVLPAALAAAVGDPIAYNRMLAVIGRYSLATVTPSMVGMHRLVQAVVQVRLDKDEERAWAETASSLIRASFPDHGWKLPTWPSCERLLPSLFTVTAHARRLQVAPEQTGWLLNRAAVNLRARGQYLQAKPLAEKALTLAQRTLGPDHPETAQRHDTLGRVMQNLGDLAGARAEHEQALRIGLAALGPDDITVGTSRGNLGRVLGLMDEPHAARAQLEQSVRITEALLGPEHHDVGIRRGNLGIVLQYLGDLDDARTELERSVQIIESALGPDHHDVGIRRGYLGWALQGSGDLDGARTELGLAVQITEGALGPDHPTVGNLRGSLALVFEELGNLDGALAQLELAVRITDAALGPDHPTVVSIRGDLERFAFEPSADLTNPLGSRTGPANPGDLAMYRLSPLVDGAQMPDRQELPPSIASLTDWQAFGSGSSHPRSTGRRCRSPGKPPHQQRATDTHLIAVCGNSTDAEQAIAGRSERMTVLSLLVVAWERPSGAKTIEFSSPLWARRNSPIWTGRLGSLTSQRSPCWE